ncbi:MAG: glycosyl hydrolase [Oscillospiraceae bacterium]|nr:glycosyl hydrolase [Oscillospiraceae bacterium]
MCKAPLFRDPIHDGAADPVVIFDHAEGTWKMFYTNRPTTLVDLGVNWVHGTDIGIAESRDGGKSWLYRGTASGLNFERGRNTYWAPEIIYRSGIYHMYVSYVRGIPNDWNHPRHILHYTSKNLWDFEFVSKLDLSSEKVIDAAVFEIAPGKWRMWYKDEAHGSHTFAADSPDLYNWEVIGEVISDCAHEGANVFRLGGYNWLITDEWHGLGVYRSDDFENWTKQGRILDRPGKRAEDGVIANHADVETVGDTGYIFYFTHPERTEDNIKNHWGNQKRSSIQAARLEVKDGILVCDRDADFEINLR